MNPVKFENAYYIKLGRGGEWEESSIEENKARIGWGGQTIEDINHRNWERIGRQLRKYFEGKGITNRGASTRDLNMLKLFTESTSHDVWITFHNSCLWWCRLKESGVQSDEISKYREVKERWSDQDIDGNRLIINQIPGRLSKIQAFRGTVCKVRAIEDLSRLLNHGLSEESRRIRDTRENLQKEVEVNSNILELKNLIEGFKLSCQTEGKSPKTTEWYTSFISRFRLFLESEELPTDLSSITKNHIREFILYLQTKAKTPYGGKPLSGATIQGPLSCSLAALFIISLPTSFY